MSSANISPRVHIGEVVRNAVLFKPGNHQEGLVNSDVLIETVARFFSLLRKRQIEYVLVGGIALLQYVEGRNTEDIDLIMAVSALERLPELHIETRDADFARGRFGDLKVDVLLTTNPLFDEVRKRYTAMQRFCGTGYSLRHRRGLNTAETLRASVSLPPGELYARGSL